MQTLLITLLLLALSPAATAQEYLSIPRSRLQLQFGLTSGYRFESGARTAQQGASVSAPVGYSAALEWVRQIRLKEPFYLLVGAGGGVHISRIRFQQASEFLAIPEFTFSFPDMYASALGIHAYGKFGGGFRFAVLAGGGCHVDVALQTGYQVRGIESFRSSARADDGQVYPLYQLDLEYNDTNETLVAPTAQVYYSRRLTDRTTWVVGLNFTASNFETARGSYRLFGDTDDLVGEVTKVHDALRLIVGVGF